MKPFAMLCLAAALPVLAACGSTDIVPPAKRPLIVDGVAYPPQNCPDWSADPTSNHANAPLPGFGCAYYRDLLVQMEDPRDYVYGRDGGSGQDVYRNSAVIQGYRSNNAVPVAVAPGTVGN